MNATALALLEKAAADNGFDRSLGPQDQWLAFSSTQAPLRVWLTADEVGRPIAALSMPNVASALSGEGDPAGIPPPAAAAAARVLPSVPALHPFLRRAFQLSRTLPDELLHTFQKATAGMPRATEAERVVVQRVGQDVFRAGLMDYWDGRCAVTGLAVPELLRASHIKTLGGLRGGRRAAGRLQRLAARRQPGHRVRLRSDHADEPRQHGLVE